mmetsp:Transcript_31806/g.123454  ORF Transcript_31806/g.123454 Transcript_31806/m.123454 type:complete len:82 (-) Transcript_31806:416-661(-)
MSFTAHAASGVHKDSTINIKFVLVSPKTYSSATGSAFSVTTKYGGSLLEYRSLSTFSAMTATITTREIETMNKLTKDRQGG